MSSFQTLAVALLLHVATAAGDTTYKSRPTCRRRG